ncbi:tRNA (guanine(10)-N2)-dimethyltransferase [uncultured archaeon]|nr:tRNA (guanine(10)-N2)-dimethyltransferase [uncultured archaeon]
MRFDFQEKRREKMKYLFLLGRNIELSVAEIKSFFERDKTSYKIISKIKNSILIETDKNLKGIVEKLGGAISMGEVIAEGNFEKLSKELDKLNLYSGKSNKLNYVVFDFHGKHFTDILLYLKNRFREEKLKATEKKLTGNVKLQSGEIVPNVISNRVNEQYFVFEDNFGRIIETCDYEKIEKRDMEKPVRREALSISPRLAKILINFSGIKEGETLLDPFCGIGTILQEALLKNMKVIGIDKDKSAIRDAGTNLEWFGFKTSDYKLINEDSSKAKIQNADAIATEPDLGELQKKFPSLEKARQVVSGFEGLIIKVINNLKKNVKGKIVFTTPLINTGKNKIECDFKKIASETGLRIAEGFPINEFREDSIVGRSIVVMKR